MQTILNVYAVNRWTRSRRNRWTRRSEPKKTGFDSLRKSDDSCRRWESSLDLTICRKSTLLNYCRTPCFMHNLHRNPHCSCFMKECVGKCKSQPQNAWNQNWFTFWIHVPGVILSSLVHVIHEKMDVSVTLNQASTMHCKHAFCHSRIEVKWVASTVYFYTSTHFLLYAYDDETHAL